MLTARLDTLEPAGWTAPAVTVGNFDGVHRGHQALVARAVEEARVLSGSSVALTFDPHPSRVLSPDRAPSALMTVEQKAEALAALGADVLAVLPFTHELSRQGPEEFAAQVLGRALAARRVVVGSNFRFGRGRAGDVGLLSKLGRDLGFEVHIVEPVFHEGAPISSTRVREALARGAVAAAAALLGRRFSVDGTVVRGEGRGRILGIPTANLAPVNETLPGGGVYAAYVRVRDASWGDRLPAVVNVGRRPTFGGVGTTVEAHVIDFGGDLYGRLLRVEFVERLREERRFPGAEALRTQIDQDVAHARVLLGGA